MAFLGEYAAWIFAGAIEIMIAKADNNRGDLAKANEEGGKALHVAGFGNAVERINTVARNNDVVRVLFFGASKDGVEQIGRDLRGEMNIGN